MKYPTTAPWWFEIGRAEALGYRVQLRTSHGLMTLQEYLAHRHSVAESPKRQESKAA
jgi:hypothetical protein